jgi:ribosomal protein S18 acetylase RimI-like enzyme
MNTNREGPQTKGIMSSASDDLLVRPAVSEDGPTIARFNVQMAWETEHLRLDPDVVARGVAAVFEMPGRGSYFVADRGGQVVGCLLVTYEWSDWRNGNIWWIQSVYVRPEARGQGTFALMYAEVERRASEAKVRAIRLYVEKDNDRAKRVYSRLGMKLTGYDVMHHDLGG